MDSYRKGYDFEDYVATGMATFVILAFIVLAAIVITLFVIALTEVVGIFRRRALNNQGQAAQWLWWSLAGFVVCLVVGSVFAANGAMAQGIILISWAFCAFVIAVEAVEWSENRRESQLQAQEPELTLVDVLRPWSLAGESQESVFAGPSVTGNGSLAGVR